MTHPYATAAYAATLPHVGAPLALAAADTHVLQRELDGTGFDLAGAYPLVACGRWDALADDLHGTGAISFVGVADPLAPTHVLAAAFPDLARPFKTHHLVDLTAPAHAATDAGHRRKARRALRSLHVETVQPRSLADDWVRLYGILRERHDVRGPAAFADDDLVGQLRLPDLRAHRAVAADGRVVGALLWVVHEGVAHYHLGAHDQEGYRLGSSFALFAEALPMLAAEGLHTADLGGGAGAVDDPADGLARFKRGWATGAADAWLVGAILDPAAYRARAERAPATGSWFPAYRSAA